MLYELKPRNNKFYFFLSAQPISIANIVNVYSALALLIAISFFSTYAQWWQLLTDKISNTAYTATWCRDKA